MSASLALTRALIAALAADATVAARVTGVFDAPPPGAVLPYLTVGPDLVSDASSFVSEARDHRLRVMAWETPLGAGRCAATLAAVEAAVLGLGSVLDGYRLEWIRFARSGVEAEAPRGPTRGLIEFTARTVAGGVA